MEKENHINNSAKIIEEFEKRGIKGTIITIEITPRLKQIEKDVGEYVMGIEDAHKKAAKSKLFFGNPLVSAPQP